MKTPYLYLIEPEGDRYNNTKIIEGKEIILNTTMDETDFKYTNRIARVIGTPKREGVLKEGDRVIVHHNTFRKWFNVKGRLKDSSNFIKEGAFYAGLDQIFAYDRGDGWTTLEDYCFVKPIEKESGFTYNVENWIQDRGIVAISNPILEKQGIGVGDEIFFVGPARYRFDIEGETYWKMSAYANVKLKL